MPRRRYRGPTALLSLLLTLSAGGTIPAASAAGTIAEYAIPTADSLPLSMALGPDGNLWFAERDGNNIGRISPDGTVTEFALPTSGSSPWGVAVGPDGNVWFTERAGNKIGRITMDGAITEFPLPRAGQQPAGITAGPDGNIWFTEHMGNRIGRITMAGVITEWAVPTASSTPARIAAGPDGNMWFTEQSGDRIGRITMAGVIREFRLLSSNRLLGGITAGPDGAMWFTERAGNAIGRIAMDGTITEFAVPTASSNPVNIATGPDGNLWFTEQNANKIAQITPGGVITEFPVPTPASQPYGITAGPDQGMWFTEAMASAVGRLDLVPADLTGPAITIASPRDGWAYMKDDVVMAEYWCTDEEGGSGVASCAGPVPSGQAIDMSPGGHRFTVTATDDAGNTTSVTHSYVVFKAWRGKPGMPQLELPPAMTRVNAGSAVPIIFSLGGDYGLDIFDGGAPAVQRIDCATMEPITPEQDAVADVGGGLRYSPDRYIYVWKTAKAWEGSCRRVLLRFSVEGGAWAQLFVRFV